MTNWYVSEPMKYWAFPSSYSTLKKEIELKNFIASHNYCFSQKWDGNWSRAIINHEKGCVLQTRGISVTTGTYGEVQTKVTWWDSVTSAFTNETVILGEIYVDGGVDRDVGSLLRCLPEKAIARQKDKPAKWRVFDVLCYEGEDISALPIVERIKYIPYVIARINNPLVTGNKYYEVDDTFYDKLSAIFEAGGEGVVMWRKDGAYQPGKRTARLTCKVKKELEKEADVLCIGLVRAVREYTGKDVENWTYWENLKTGELLKGYHYQDYISNHSYEPVSKGYFYGWPGAIRCGALKEDGTVAHVCDVSGLTEELKTNLRDNFHDYLMKPMKVTAMEVTPDGSLRHPRFLGFRDDINTGDCTLSKIIG